MVGSIGCCRGLAPLMAGFIWWAERDERKEKPPYVIDLRQIEGGVRSVDADSYEVIVEVVSEGDREIRVYDGTSGKLLGSVLLPPEGTADPTDPAQPQ